MKSNSNGWKRGVHRALMGLGTVGLMALVAAPAMASVPVSITKQGRLLDNDGSPLTGNRTLNFVFYDRHSGGTVLWSDSVDVNLGDSGIYSVVLGDDTQPIDAELLREGQVFVTLSVDGGPEFSPRLELTSVPFAALAQHAEVANRVAAGAITADSLADGAITSAKIDTISWDKITDVPAGITNGSDTLGELNCSSGQIALFDGSAWTCAAMPTYTGSNFALANQSCSGTQVVTGISATGTLTCAAPPSTTYTAGTGLSLSGSNVFALDTTYADNRYVTKSGATGVGGLSFSAGAALSLTGGIIIGPPPFGAIIPTGNLISFTYEGDVAQFAYDHHATKRFNMTGPSGWNGLQVTNGPIATTGTTGSINASGDIAVNTNASAVNSYIRFRGSSGTSVPRIYHNEGTTDASKRFSFTGAPGGIHVNGNLSASGTKNFVQPHPKHADRMVKYAAAEAGEAGVYWRGTARTQNGEVVIDLPEHFALVTSEQGLTTNITPRGKWAPLYVKSVSPSRLVVGLDEGFGQGDVEFDFYVSGIRAGFEDYEAVVHNDLFTPEHYESFEDFEKEIGRHPHIRDLLIRNGTLTRDGKINHETVKRLGWKLAAQ